MTNTTDKLLRLLDGFEHECYMLRVEASETRAKDEVVRDAYGRIREEAAQAIAATLGGETNQDGLPVGLTISEDGSLLNWRGENYVRQSTLGGGECEITSHYYYDDYDLHEFEFSCGHSYTIYDDVPHQFCPICGAKVKAVER